VLNSSTGTISTMSLQAFFCFTTLGAGGMTIRNSHAASIAPKKGQIQYT